MELEIRFFLLIYFITALLAAGVAWKGRRRIDLPGSTCFVLLMAAASLLALLSAFELAASEPQQKIFWSKLYYIPNVSLAPLWLMFAHNFSRRPMPLSWKRGLILWIIPAITLALALTNDWHGLIWPEIAPVSDAPGARLIYTHGPAFWLHAVFAYTALFAGTLLLINLAGRLPSVYRLQIAALIGAALLPWIANLAYLTGALPWSGIDLTAMAFLISGILALSALYHYRLLDLVPVARTTLFNSLGSGVLVVDLQNRLVDLNPLARQWTGLRDADIGKDIYQLLPYAGNLHLEQTTPDAPLQLELGPPEERSIYDLTITTLSDERHHPQGWVILVHDVTQQRRLLDAEQTRSRQIELLNGVTRAALSISDTPQMYQFLLQRVSELFHSDGAVLMLWNEERQSVIPQAAFGLAVEVFHHMRSAPGGFPLTQVVLETRSVLSVEDTQRSPYVNPLLLEPFPIGALLALPLIGSQQKLGALLVSFSQARHFSPEDLILAEQAASQIALAVDKAMLLDSEKRYTAQLASLNSISQAVAASLDLQEIFDTVVRLLHQTFGYDYVSIYRLYDQVLRLGACTGYPAELIISEIPISAGVMGRTVRTRQPQFVPDVDADAEFLRAADQVGSEICVPLLKDQEVLGTLNIEVAPDKILTQWDLRLLTSFAAQVSVAIENARLFSDLRRRAEKERLLFAATRDFTAGLDSDTVYQAIAHHMISSVKVDGCTISRWDRAADCVVTLLDTALEGLMAVDSPGTPYALRDYPLTRQVLEERQPVILNLTDKQLDPAEASVMQACGYASVILLPLVIGRGQHIYGLVELQRKDSEHPFVKEDLEMGLSILAQAAIAIENANLYAEKQRLAIIDELTGLYNRRGILELGRRELERSRRYEYPLTALFIDIDLFKLFNDRYSYAVGDQVLRMLAFCLRSNLREIDLIGRFGGEEFIIFLPQTSRDRALEVAERLRVSVERMVVSTDQSEEGITVSIGISQARDSDLNPEMLIERTGQVLHIAKSGGRNQVTVEE